MAVAFDAQTMGPTFTTTSPNTFLHTPVGTPRGVVVCVTLSVAADTVSAVTYGGVAMSQILNISDAGGEGGRAYVFFLGASVPTGAQTVSIAHSGGAFNKAGSAVTATAAADTEIGDSDSQSGPIDDPSITLTTTPVSLRVGAIHTGLNALADFTETAGFTNIGGYSNNFRSAKHSRETTPASGAVNYGFTTPNASDLDLVGVAVQEVAAPPVPTAPSNLAATALSTTSIGLTWDDNASDETSFRVERSLTGAGSWVTAGTPAADAETFTDTGRICGTQYFYRVFAVNGSGDSTASNTDDATTLACPPPATGGNRMGGSGAIRRPPRTFLHGR